ncbi:KR domain-containing protein [Streptomyces sp. LX-29]|uniref:KR domain-containing protein n=1 Tax=Streptomyces sp. LX-29 TaxID=2900152 RepID=UPI00240DB51B|nr:KR domain-containing protein [Streptomyces sp. LX-29]WFB06678.1 KR domain-containing protein [Streptomyces sp. LX-29]
MTLTDPTPVAAPPAPAEGPAEDAAVQPVTRMVWELTELPPAVDDPARLAGLRVLLLGGEPAVARAVGVELTRCGARVRHGAAHTGPVDAIVDLTVGHRLSAGGREAVGAWRAALTETVTALRGVYDAWAAETAADRLFYLAVSYLGGGMGQHPDDDLAQPLGGIWAGLAKTLHREFPNCNARVVDLALDAAAELPGIVAAELGRVGQIEVGYRDGRRLTLTPGARPPAAPALTLGPADTVLVSGGGRGIGWELARTLAERHGVRVVVTGREPFPTGDEPWFGADEAALKAYERGVWAERPPGRSPAEVRRRLGRERRLWELAANLTSARRHGLRIDYARCDFTDPAQVRELVRREGGALTGVIHNAGVDTAARLPKKSDAEILRTVEVKVDGFLHLFEEVRQLDLKFFCAVGSLTGRLGGMVGQLEYAAANDGLARLGTWADRRAAFPVMTLAWPTWDRIGLIANFGATLRYMAAIDVADGLARWEAELLAGTAGEVTFVGPLGRAIDPGQAVGYPVVPALPGFQAAYPRIFHLGEVTAFQPHARLDATVVFDRDRAPVLGDFQVDGGDAVPVSVLLENAVRGAEWLVPEDYPALRVAAVERIVVPLALLRLDGGRLRLTRTARGFHEGRDWVVEVRYRRAGDTGAGEDGGEATEASLRVVHRRDAEPPGPLERPAVTQSTTLRSGPPFLRWRSAVVPAAAWHTGPDGRPVAEVRPCAANDLWATPQVPHPALPVAPLENIVRRCARRGEGLSVTVDPLVIGRIAPHAAERGPSRVEGDPALGVWRVTRAATGEPVLTVSGLPGPLGDDPPGPSGDAPATRHGPR